MFVQPPLKIDCDGLIEYHDKTYVPFELKHGKKELPDGQKLALVRMCDDFARINKNTYRRRIERRN